MKTLVFFLFLIQLVGCDLSQDRSTIVETKRLNLSAGQNEIECDDVKCFGAYIGPEFIAGADVAHQFSNKMSKVVGDQLKELFDKGHYSKVNFSSILMSTEGMGSGNVTYILEVPFERVASKCEAYTSFDHVGGWNHTPALERRKRELEKLLLAGDSLHLSNLKRTKEGLQEYWIQWRNNIIQLDCMY